MKKYSKPKLNTKTIKGIIFLSLFVLSTVFSYTSSASFNPQINYQGKLRNVSTNSVVEDGNYNIEFNIYTVSSGGTPIWTEQRTTTDKVPVTDGLFSVMLGSVTTLENINFNQDLYLGVKIGSTTTVPTWDSEMTPRKKFGSVPASFISERVIGSSQSSIGTTSPITNTTLTVEATSTNTTALTVRGFTGQVADLFRIISNTGTQLFNFTADGKLGIGTSSPYAPLSVVGEIVTSYITATSTTATSTFAHGLEASLLNITSSTATSTFANGIDLSNGCFSINGTCIGGGSSSQWSDGTNNSIYYNLGNVGIGTSSPYTALSVVGETISTYFTATSTTATSTFGFINVLGTNSTSTFSGNVQVNGNLKVGTDSVYLTTTGIRAGNNNFSINTNATTSFSTSTGFIIGTSTNTSFAVQQTTGNVGIGTSTPNYGFTVATRDSAFNAGYDGDTGEWKFTTSLPEVRAYHKSIEANGYVYVIQGCISGSCLDANGRNTVLFAKVNSDGTLGQWSYTSPLVVDGVSRYRAGLMSVAINGYLYILGGYGDDVNQEGGNISYSNVFYSKINSDGTLGGWRETTSMLANKNYGSAIYSNGYIYVSGGSTSYTGSPNNTVYYVKVNSDGTLGQWKPTQNLLDVRIGHSSVSLNGYIYVVAGGTTWVTSPTNTVYYSKINYDGSLGNWSTTNPINIGGAQNRILHEAIISNSKLYVIGGNDFSTVLYANINKDGTIGTWAGTRNMNTSRYIFGSILANGYIYSVGGFSGGALSSVEYTSLPRTTMATNLDLIGFASTTLSDPASGGSAGASIFAGDIYSNGTLEVTGNTNLWNGLSVNGLFSLKATTSFSQDYSIFSIQNATGTNPILTALYNGNVGIGTSSPYAKLSVAGEILSSYFTATTSATSTFAGPIEANVLNITSSTATSTFANGIDLSNGCFSINGTCIGGGSSSQWLDGTNNSIYYNLGNVGIGTSSPYAKLSVVGETVSTYFTATSTTATSTFGFINVLGTNSTSTFSGNLQVNGTLKVGTDSVYLTTTGIRAGNNNFSINTNATTSFSTSTGFMIGTSTNTAFSVQQTTGNVGIGTSTPNYGFTVATRDSAFNAGYSGETGEWRYTKPLLGNRSGSTSVILNGYAYVMGGYVSPGSATDIVYYSKINSNGSIYNWNTTKVLPGDRWWGTSVSYNGIIYYIGGWSSSSSAHNNVWYARPNLDGSITTWNTGNNINLPARYVHTSVVYNGYIYVIGGSTVAGGTSSVNTIYFARINSNGDLDNWKQANNLPYSAWGLASTVANGYLYVLGGTPNASTYYSDVNYAKINPDGTLGSWTATKSLSSRMGWTPIVYSNGYIYTVGGHGYLGGNGGLVIIPKNYIGKVNSSGGIDNWATSTKDLLVSQYTTTANVYNGYVYSFGGNYNTTVQFTSLPRTTMATNLDLIGFASTTLSDPASGGSAGASIFAGDIYSNGTLEVTGNTNLWNGLNVNGLFSLKATTSSNQDYSIFSIQNATSTNSLFTVYYNGRVGIGTSTPNQALSIGDGTSTSSLSINKGAICIDDDGYCTPGLAGSITAVLYETGNSDLAENYSSDEQLEPGDIITTKGLETVGKTQNKDSIALGIVSTKPGIRLGSNKDEENNTRYPIALSGRVPVKVNLENGPIKTGDRITLSSTPGIGAKYTDLSTQSVGIALEDYNGEPEKESKILAFVNLSYQKLDPSIQEGSISLSLWNTDSTTGYIIPTKSQTLDMRSQNIINIGNLISSSGKWSISEDGRMVVSEVEADFAEVLSGFTVKDRTTGESVCLYVQNGNIVNSLGECQGASVSSFNNSTPEILTDETEDSLPVIILNGNNPANIELNSTYVDMGARVTDDEDDNLGYRTEVWENDVKLFDDINNNSLDTSKNTTYIIKYNATDSDLNNAIEVIRTVIVGTGIAEEVTAEENSL